MTTVPSRRLDSTTYRSTRKIEYLELLWNRIAATPETLPVPEWHREVLMGRLLDLESDPNSGESWDVAAP